MMYEDGWGDGDYGSGRGDDIGDGNGYGTANGGGRGVGYRRVVNYGLGDGDSATETDENHHCTRMCNGNIQFFICQQVMLASTKEK